MKTETLQLPLPISNYFAADSVDSEAAAKCFTENAVVKDEAHTHTGRAAIRQWKEEVSKKYQYTNEPLTCEEQAGRTVVTTRVAGSFPGSPVDLRFCFELDGDEIASLEIVP